MDWALSPLSRLMTVVYLIFGVPIMFMYLRTTGSLCSRALRFLCRQMVCSFPFKGRRTSVFGSASSGNDSTSNLSDSRPSTTGLGKDRVSLTSIQAAKRSKWQTRGNQEHMQLKPTSGSLGSVNVIDFPDEKRPAVAFPILGCLMMLIVYLLSGAAFIAESQNINYRDAFYFCFVALCTVGFGGNILRFASDTTIVLVVIYIFFGVTLLSTTLHIVHYDVYVNLRRYRDLKHFKSRHIARKGSSKSDDISTS